MNALAVRQRICARQWEPSWFREQLLAVYPHQRDTWAHQVLGLEEPPDDVALPRGAVPYLPCGVEAILAAVDSVNPGDLVVDLGSGLGKVAFLIHLLTGARTMGVEIQPPLVERSRQLAAELGLEVRFVEADASAQPLEGDVVFIYSTFNGEMLERVVAAMKSRARQKPLVLCAVGFELDTPWLTVRNRDGEWVIYESQKALEPSLALKRPS